MSFSLYHAVVPPYLMMLGSVAELLAKAEWDCADQQVPESNILDARLAPDMLPFAYHMKSTAVHSAGAGRGDWQGRLYRQACLQGYGVDAGKVGRDRQIFWPKASLES